MPRLLPLAVLASASFAAAGCGTSADRRDVRSTAVAFIRAYAGHEGRSACEQLSPALRKQVAADEQRTTCAEAITAVKLAARTVRSVRVFATSAVVQLDGEAMFLGARGGRWRIDALGCRPIADGQPLDCKEQA